MPSPARRQPDPAVRDDRLRRAMPLRGIFRLRPVADTWRWSALSALIAIGVPEVVLLAVGRLELAFYTCAGGLCALYAHGLPYAARARALAWLVAGMVAGTGVALATAALTESAAVRVAVIALLAGVFKVVCDATRIGPPGNVILTFVTATAAFLPNRLTDLPWHLTLVLAGGLLAWLICLAPSLFRPHGPERRAVARALESTARLLRTPSDAPPATRLRYETAASVQAAWHALRLVPARTPPRAAELEALAHLVARAESLAAATHPLHPESPRPVPPSPGRAESRERSWTGERSDRMAAQGGGPLAGRAEALEGWARALRGGRSVPVVGRVAVEDAEVRGLAVERAADRRGRGWRRVARAFAPSSPLFPIGARVAIGSAAAGWASMALGVDRPYWAVVTAAAVYVANTALTWQRAVQRVVGNLGGVLLFTALVPLLRGAAVLVVVALVCQLVVEATISRNYALATIFVTPMALVMTEFALRHPARELVADRWLDTCVGAAVGMLVCFAIPNRRVTGRVDAALRTLDAATTRAHAPDDRAGAREQLAAALIELREAADTASGEWWSAPIPQERVVAAERTGHRLLAELTPRPVVV
ncbi:FUSC family protein [Nocardia wallacei]|uniref:FUSC family protein n=1 Tax=Nocardia wallacei TaxID=480035 RepID=UPI002458EA19|nr:FUSC family protein [Nocardia wallacei]